MLFTYLSLEVFSDLLVDESRDGDGQEDEDGGQQVGAAGPTELIRESVPSL